MYTLVLTEPVLRVRGMIALLMFAAVSVFWTALVLPLSAPPHALSHTAIGAFGLVGVAGVLMAARAPAAGRWQGSAPRARASCCCACRGSRWRCWTGACGRWRWACCC